MTYESVYDPATGKWTPSGSAIDALGGATLVAQTITDGVSNSAPSQDAVHDALTLKASVAAAVPTGGAAAQVLKKASSTDYDTAWGDVAALSNATPRALGTAAAGTSVAASRDDHVHPSPAVSGGPGLAVGAYVFPAATYGTVGYLTTLNDLRLVPLFITASSVTFDRFSIYVTGSGSSGATCRLGVFNAKDGVGFPTTVVYDSGSLAATANPATVTPSSLTLTAGKYWLAYVSQSAPSTAPSVFACNAGTNMGLAGVPWIPGSNLQGQAGLHLTGVTGALADLSSQTWANTNFDGNVVMPCLRVSAYTA
jgi:hypothetical protein